ncbi:conserved hypothetical protein [Ricinus communis]|uniref:Uncharacterized protein n=1 Tax=Ricinus communis TaxID=3988 RepID=B9T7L8_RICCO|nr:conserved hypothetical protein [Ricinus communis]
MSSTTLFFMALLIYSLILLSPPVTFTGANATSRVAVAAARPLPSKSSKELVAFRPKTTHGRKGFRGRDVENCLPKGFHRTSAPSRYINYDTLGATMCSTGKHVDAP